MTLYVPRFTPQITFLQVMAKLDYLESSPGACMEIPGGAHAHACHVRALLQ